MEFPTVFITYTHDNAEHCAAVRRFATILHGLHIRSENDFWSDWGRKDWGLWAEKYIDETDYTLLIASANYRKVGDGKAADDQNRGGVWEIRHLRERLQKERSVWTKRILPVVLPGNAVEDIPFFLHPYSCDRYIVRTLDKDGVENLYRSLTKQPEHTRPPLGKPLILPPKSGPGSPGWDRS